jgi:gliding motility-associated-like protein
VTINDGCSDPHNDTITITVLSINPTLISSPPVCFGETGYSTFDLTQKVLYSFNWTNRISNADTIFGPGNDTNYLRITNTFGCFIDTFMVINGYGYLKADYEISPDIYPKCLSSNNKKLIVTDKSIGAISGSWSFGDGTILPYNSVNTTETNIYEDGGNYIVQLIVKNAGPCFDTLDYNICVSDQLFFIADIFSPNGDGMNDILYVRSSEVEKIDFYVFDRWGKVIFESNDVANGWDGTYKGKDMEAGIYFYSVKLYLETGEILLEKGDITLKR